MSEISKDAPPQNILFINVSRIGDTLLATPAIRAVAKHWPQAKIDVLAHPKREEVLRFLPFVRRTGSITKLRAPFMGWLGNTRYQLAFAFNFDPALFKYAFRVADRVVAFRQSDEDINRRLFKIVDHPVAQTEHAADIRLRLPESLGIAPAGRHLAYCVTSEEKVWATNFIEHGGLIGKSPLVGLQIASYPTKAWRDWPLDSFVDLCRRIGDAWPKAHFLIFGGKLEKQRTSQLAKQLGPHATLCAGKLTLRQTAALMNCLDLYVGVDTGPTHVMGALQRPMVVLYHSHSPSRLYGPLDHPCAYVIDCPCKGPAMSWEVSMAEISVDKVWNTVSQALNE